MKIVYSPSAHNDGFNGAACSGFFIDTMGDLPDDTFQILPGDITTARNLPAGSTYTFTAPTDLDMPGELVITPPSNSYNVKVAQETQIANVKAACDAANAAPVSYMGTTFQTDADSLIAITAAISGGVVEPDFAWYDCGNVAVPMTYPQLQGLMGAIIARGQPNVANMQTKKVTIKALSDVTAIQQITF